MRESKISMKPHQLLLRTTTTTHTTNGHSTTRLGTERLTGACDSINTHTTSEKATDAKESPSQDERANTPLASRKNTEQTSAIVGRVARQSRLALKDGTTILAYSRRVGHRNTEESERVGWAGPAGQQDLRGRVEIDAPDRVQVQRGVLCEPNQYQDQWETRDTQ